jgi:hypothetical protein
MHLMNDGNRRAIFVGTIFGIACLVVAGAPAFAQQNATATPTPWRPAEGLYVSTLTNCEEYADVIVDLAEKAILGHEWSCEVTKLTDTAPGAIQLNMTCDDYNLAQALNPKDPNWESRKFKEIMYLRKVDDKSMVVRKTTNGKLKYPSWRALYCPEKDQRAYIEDNEKAAKDAATDAAERAKWEQKAAEERKAIEERIKANSQK